jgi:thiosulfate/3-mercaptopyruvate sulfurtransferase
LNNDSDIVLYDDGPGAFAARAWWLLAWLGKRDGVYLLDGGFKAWRESGLPLDASVPADVAGSFSGDPDDSLIMEAAQLSSRLDTPELTLIDARALPRFLGEIEPIDPIAGHIPSASCAPFTENLDATGRFLQPTELHARFDQLLAGKAPETLVAYCGSGVTACHNLFALCLAGYPLAKLYPGSWSEWITDPQRPVA